MAVDVSDFIVQQPSWGGLYKAAESMERRQLKKEQMDQQSLARKQASATFLKSYLDPKAFGSGTAYDPLIIDGLQQAMQQGADLASKGVDTPTIMMALGPQVSKVADYSTRAKAVSKAIDDQIKQLKDQKVLGYNFGALKEEAIRNAFYDTAEDGTTTINPEKADPSVNWLAKAVESAPEKVTDPQAWNVYAQKSPAGSTLTDITRYSPKGEMTREKVNIKGQNYLIPEYDDKGDFKEMVPRYETATDGSDPLIGEFLDQSGKGTKAPIRLLDEQHFDALPPGLIDNIKGQLKPVLSQYEKETGNKIGFDDPRAKNVARAIAYDELNNPARKAIIMQQTEVQGKPSPAQINLQIQSSPEYLETERKKAAARKQGRLDVADEEKLSDYKVTTVETIGNIFNNDEETLKNPEAKLSGKAVEYGSGKTTALKNVSAIDVTSAFPGGGLKSGRGDDYDYKKIYYDPTQRQLIVQKETGTGFKKRLENEVVPESKVGQFIYQIAEANGVPRQAVKKMLTEMGYSGGKFTKADRTFDAKRDFEKRQQQRKVTDVILNPFGKQK